MSAMKEVAIEVAEALAKAEGPGGRDDVEMLEELFAGRVRLGALGPSGRVWVAEDSPTGTDAILELVFEGGMGLVAAVDGGPWVTVREVAGR